MLTDEIMHGGVQEPPLSAPAWASSKILPGSLVLLFAIAPVAVSGSHNGNIDGFQSGYIRSNETFEFTFEDAMILDYHCAPHPTMWGQIIVEAGVGGPTRIEITIVNYTFIPGNISIELGTTLNWTNLDSVPHTVSQNQSEPYSMVEESEEKSSAIPGPWWSLLFLTWIVLAVYVQLIRK